MEQDLSAASHWSTLQKAVVPCESSFRDGFLAQPLTNRLIEALPKDEKTQLLGMLDPVALPLKTSLFYPGETPRYVHFLTSGLGSVVTEMSKGKGVEVALLGRESLPQSVYLLGPQATQFHCYMQLAGTGLRMDFKRFQNLFQQSETLRALVLRHVQYELLMAAQLAACNRLHQVEERLARWLLMASARIGSLEVHLTQEFLSIMLGARRSTVTLAAGTLQRAGLIEYRRGNIHILEKERLESAACECHRITQKIFESLYR